MLIILFNCSTNVAASIEEQPTEAISVAIERYEIIFFIYFFFNVLKYYINKVA